MSEVPIENRQSFKTTCRQFWLISKAFFGSERRHKARGFLIALLLLALAVGGIQILMSYAGRDFFTAIERKRPGAYWVALGWYLGSFALAVPIGVYYRWVEERLALLWREWLALHFPERAAHVMSLVNQMRGGKDYDSAFGTRMRGTGPFAQLIVPLTQGAVQLADARGFTGVAFDARGAARAWSSNWCHALRAASAIATHRHAITPMQHIRYTAR